MSKLGKIIDDANCKNTDLFYKENNAFRTQNISFLERNKKQKFVI